MARRNHAVIGYVSKVDKVNKFKNFTIEFLLYDLVDAKTEGNAKKWLIEKAEIAVLNRKPISATVRIDAICFIADKELLEKVKIVKEDENI